MDREPGVPRRSSSYTFSTPYFPIWSLSVYGLSESAFASNSSSMIWPVYPSTWAASWPYG